MKKVLKLKAFQFGPVTATIRHLPSSRLPGQVPVKFKNLSELKELIKKHKI